MAKPKILIVSLGGTITMTRSEDGTISPNLTAADLLASVPGIDAHADIEAVSPFKMPGASLTINHLIEVSELIESRLAADADGAIVIQGTDTIEETAFALDVLVRSGKPIIVTGAMRGPEAAGADGPGNILAAVLTAGSEEAKGLGTLVVLNDQIHAARFVQKMHTALPSAFASPTAGPLGIVAENRARIYLRCARTPGLPARPEKTDAPIALLTLGLGDDGRILKGLRDLGFRGVVVAGMGAGHVPAVQVPLLEELAASMPVVLATRVAAGPVFSRTYGFAGSETDLLARGLVSAGNLSALKARLLLAFLVRAVRERSRILDLIGEIARH